MYRNVSILEAKQLIVEERTGKKNRAQVLEAARVVAAGGSVSAPVRPLLSRPPHPKELPRWLQNHSVS